VERETNEVSEQERVMNAFQKEKTLDLSIIIVNWNTVDLLRQCLQSIYANTHGVDYEAFVVDNNSSDGSTQMVSKCFTQVRLIPNRENYGFAKANNQAIAQCNGRYILFLNPDTTVVNNAIGKMLSFMKGHPDTGALGCKLLNPDGTLQPSCRSFPSFKYMFYEWIGLSRLFPKSKIFGRYKMTYWDHKDVREVDQPMGACLMVRRDVIDQVGPFDEGYFMLFEEVDLCYRIKKAGWKIYFIPDAEVIHHHSYSVNKVKNRMLFNSHKGMYRFYKKHYVNGKTSLMAVPFVGAVLFLLAVLRIAINTTRKVFYSFRKK
jgi:GT2 family glycosyltransferase